MAIEDKVHELSEVVVESKKLSLFERAKSYSLKNWKWLLPVTAVSILSLILAFKPNNKRR